MEIGGVFTGSSVWIDLSLKEQESKRYGSLLFNLLLLRMLVRLLSPYGTEHKDSPPRAPSQLKREATPSMVAGVTGGYHHLLEEVARKYRLPLNLLQGLVKVESNFNSRAVSPSGALGLMQLMPETARALGVKDPFDPSENLEAGARYLRQMLDLFRGNVELALAAYNAGPGVVQRYGGIPPYKETREYIERVKEAARKFEAWG
ncbi:MAG: lytic transglycosylase domain-containing protein [Thermanaeromonas sp.]|uniref:lytic transglycosylase domain-containing protein n=1 Tax=Thermanaeromonas sp. TaxID=2003697 RepID=UPI00243963FA|nr:lytic transglycosylase domain-containing protein [Thermanaeromonas sp.]MCG0278608.1 lytic transglycosylase domain-containing protein [Thermanaeromonas sp.]